MRLNLSGSGFSREDRDTNILRIGFVANLLARNGVGVISAAISPYRETRDAVRRMVEADGVRFIEAHVAASLEECEARDVKGLYAGRRGRASARASPVSMTRMSRRPPEIVIPTGQEPLEASIDRVLGYLEREGLIARAAEAVR